MNREESLEHRYAHANGGLVEVVVVVLIIIYIVCCGGFFYLYIRDIRGNFPVVDGVVCTLKPIDIDQTINIRFSFGLVSPIYFF